MKHLRSLWASFMQMVEDYAYWAEYGKRCYGCRWRWSPEVMVDVSGDGMYACPKCYREIQEWCDYDEV